MECPLCLAGRLAILPYAEAGLIRITSSPLEEIEPQWSPDGRKLSYGAGREGDQYVVVYDLAARTETRLTQGLAFVHSTTWSPDGSRIAFVSCDREGSMDVWVVDVPASARQ